MLASEFSSGLDNLEYSQNKNTESFPQKKNYKQRTIVKQTGFLEEKIFKPSLFRKNPEVPKLKSSNAVEPVIEQLFSSKLFQDSNFHPHMVANLEQTLHITQVTKVQELTIPVIQEGKDVLVRSQTGSGKTIAYAIPIIEGLHKIRPKLNRKDGLKVVIVLPTRELAIQTYEWFVKLLKPFTWLVPGLLIGGEKRKSEKARLRKGIIILIGTPGRLLDHIKNTKCVTFQFLKWLVIDEADRLLELGYEKDITSLIENIDRQIEHRRQTVLLSATLTNKVEKLAGLSLHNPIIIDPVCENNIVDSIDSTLIIPDSLLQFYIVVPAKLRLVTLTSLLLDKCSKNTNEGKILVFMGTQAMVDYHTELFSTVLPDVNFYKLHGKMTQAERTEVFKSFRSYESGILMCSDVAARGLDLPQVDWIIQYTAPITSTDYVHRVGRTARVGLRGSAVLFLAPHEINYVTLLQNHNVNIKEEQMENYLQKLLTLNFADDDKVKTMESAATALQFRFMNAVTDQKLLHLSGCQAFISWARFYASYPKELRYIFNFKELHLGHYAKSFALQEAPKTISGIGKPKNLR
ncbi:hypothetical protein PGB90_003001 [Kerria lacca]